MTTGTLLVSVRSSTGVRYEVVETPDADGYLNRVAFVDRPCDPHPADRVAVTLARETVLCLPRDQRLHLFADQWLDADEVARLRRALQPA